MYTDNKIARYSRSCVRSHVVAAVLLYLSATPVQAQVDDLPEFLDRHFRAEAVEVEDGSDLHTQFDYESRNILLSRSLKMIHDGKLEDSMAVEVRHNAGALSSKLSYNRRHARSSENADKNSGIDLDFQYHSLQFKHRSEESSKILGVAMPFDLFAAQLDLSYRWEIAKEAQDTTETYAISSDNAGFKFSFTWEVSDDNLFSEYNTEYVLSNNVIIKFNYSDNGELLSRRLLGEYIADDYRLTGEFMSQFAPESGSYLTGSFGIEKLTELAELKLGLEYDNRFANPSVFFRIESELVF